jgi:hypothetical protein
MAHAESNGRVRIESFLDRCDVVKFAKYIPARSEHETATQDALKILEGVREAVARKQMSPQQSGDFPADQG